MKRRKQGDGKLPYSWCVASTSQKTAFTLSDDVTPATPFRPAGPVTSHYAKQQFNTTRKGGKEEEGGRKIVERREEGGARLSIGMDAYTENFS